MGKITDRRERTAHTVIENKAVFHNITVEKDEMLEFVSKMVNKKAWN